MEMRGEEVSVNKSAGGNCRGRDESDPARSVEAVSDSAAKNARETRQVGERVAGPAGYYVHSDSMDERLHARPAALQVSTPVLPMRNFATLVMKREENANRGRFELGRRATKCSAERVEKRDKREVGSDGHQKTVRGNETVTHAGREKIFSHIHTRMHVHEHIHTHTHIHRCT